MAGGVWSLPAFSFERDTNMARVTDEYEAAIAADRIRLLIVDTDVDYQLSLEDLTEIQRQAAAIARWAKQEKEKG